MCSGCTVQYSAVQYSTQRAMCRRTPVSMSSPAGTVTPLGESLASSYCGSLTPLASSPSGEGGFDSGGFLSTNRGPALIQDHLRCAPARETRLCMTRHHPCSLLLHIVGCPRLHSSCTPLIVWRALHWRPGPPLVTSVSMSTRTFSAQHQHWPWL